MSQRILIACSAGVFLSAGLVFLIQPLFARLLLPEFGGSPSVWNTCTVFFQATLLLGYCYTWLSTKWLPTVVQIGVHCSLLLLTLTQLPIGLRFLEVGAASTSPALQLLIMLTLSIGGPYFAVSTTTPLLQHWFSKSRHQLARDPYFFYSISNCGSILGLLAYPFVVERMFDLNSQGLAWSIGYGTLVGLTIACGVLTWSELQRGRTGTSDADSDANPVGEEATPRMKLVERPMTKLRRLRRLRWVVLALVPSAMMLAVTTRITTDVAAVPLFWVLPLVAYLATYINAFARKPLLKFERLLPILFPALMVAAWMSLVGPGSQLRAGFEIIIFLICGIVLHGELAADRPLTEYLTEYYFWMSLGGCLGGTLVGIIAPSVFPSYVEFPLVLVLAALTQQECPTVSTGSLYRGVRVVGTVILCGTAMVACFAHVWASSLATTSQFVGFAALGVFFLMNNSRGIALAMALVLIPPALLPDTNSLARKRTFFGVHEVTFEEDTEIGLRVHLLAHGTTIHGEQVIAPAELQKIPRTYYVPTGPIGEALTLAGAEQENRRVALIGLGSGALMTYSKQGDQFDFFEIDPAVRDIAQDPKLFTYLSCGEGKQRVIIGDGRIKLAETKEGTYDVIVLDAFGSDSIPIHLLTADALDIFMSRLKSDGTLIIHISNRHMDLEPVPGRYASERNLPALASIKAATTELELAQGQRPTHAVVISRSERLISELARLKDWHAPRRNVSLWTDSHSSVLDVLRFE
ncbi:MAG: fused MFS/spermidine synthase [Planctomycetota bacterium]|nr:fused MFS/spermidine synthase [Planctomycetota bacterium]